MSERGKMATHHSMSVPGVPTNRWPRWCFFSANRGGIVTKHKIRDTNEGPELGPGTLVTARQIYRFLNAFQKKEEGYGVQYTGPSAKRTVVSEERTDGLAPYRTPGSNVALPGWTQGLRPVPVAQPAIRHESKLTPGSSATNQARDPKNAHLSIVPP